MIWRNFDIMTVCCSKEHEPVGRIHRCGRPYVTAATILPAGSPAANIRDQFAPLMQNGIHLEAPYHLTSQCVQCLETAAVPVHFDGVTEENQAVKYRGGGEDPGPVVRVGLAVRLVRVPANHPLPQQ